MGKTKSIIESDDTVASVDAPAAADAPMSLQEAVAQAEKWGHFVRAFAQINATAQTILAFEQNRKEREALLEKLAEEIRAAQSTLAMLQSAAQLAKHNGESAVADAKELAGELVRQARTDAKAITDTAQAEVARLTAEHDELQSSVALATSQVTHAQAALDEVNGKLDGARAKLREMLGV